jgi:phage/conjugal plasmid C-4 type zinc finger TraR family protein
MADSIDAAADLVERERAAIIARRPRMMAETVTERDCCDCGDPIPVARMKAAPWTIRCVECQQEFEGKND